MCLCFGCGGVCVGGVGGEWVGGLGQSLGRLGGVISACVVSLDYLCYDRSRYLYHVAPYRYLLPNLYLS